MNGKESESKYQINSLNKGVLPAPVKTKLMQQWHYTCDHCSFRTKYREEYTFHKCSHLLSPQHFCYDTCDYKCNIASNLKGHSCDEVADPNNIANNLKLGISDLSGKPLNASKQLGPTEISFDVIKEEITPLFKCELCSFISKAKGNLKLHSLIHRKYLLTCNDCSFVTSFKSLLVLHSQKYHVLKDERTFHCSECSFSCCRQLTFNRHILTHTQTKSKIYVKHDVQVPPSPKKFLKCPSLCLQKLLICSSCSFKTSLQLEYEKHLLVHKLQMKVISKCNKPISRETRKKNLPKMHEREANNTVLEGNAMKCTKQYRKKKLLASHKLQPREPSKRIKSKMAKEAIKKLVESEKREV